MSEDYYVPDVIGAPIRAWRTWKTIIDQKNDKPRVVLESVNQGYIWEPRQIMRGQCKPDSKTGAARHTPSQVPADDCSCGIYARQEKLPLAQESYTSILGPGRQNMIWGAVDMWGRIVEGKTGIKAQFAYPAEFWLRKDMTLAYTNEESERVVLDVWMIRDILETTYGVPTNVIKYLVKPDGKNGHLALRPLTEDEVRRGDR